MANKIIRRITALSMAAMLLLPLSACALPKAASKDTEALTWVTWDGYSGFLDLLGKNCPDIDLDFISYTGSNRTGYSWAQMQGDDISDIFITSQVLDEGLAEERLADLSGYDFINGFPTSVLDQMSIDGGIYLLPVNYAMHGIFYNKTLMEDHGWDVPQDFAELKALCAEIKKAGLIPGVLGTQLTGNTFSAVFNLAKTDWLTTPEGTAWEQDFLAGSAAAKGMWEDTMDYAGQYKDIGMFYTDPQDRNNPHLILDYLGNRKAVFFTAVLTVNIKEFPDNGDKIGMMPYISRDGSKNIYMYNPTSYIGISRRLTEPGNEKKLENALRILSLLYSPEGQKTFIGEDAPCVMSVLNNASVPEGSMIYDAQKSLQDGRAFKMTYAHWEKTLSDMGQAFKEWFRGEGGMDAEKCIARMDELQQHSLSFSDQLYFCESMADFTLEETAELIGKALGSAVDVDAVMVPVGEYHKGSEGLKAGITGKLYAGKINSDIASTICPAYDGEYAVMEMTGAQVKGLAQTGFDANGDGNPYPYLLVTRGKKELAEEGLYRVAFLMQGYTEETAEAFSAQVHTESLKNILINYLQEQKKVSPDQNPWE